jgi:hypothetical protein
MQKTECFFDKYHPVLKCVNQVFKILKKHNKTVQMFLFQYIKLEKVWKVDICKSDEFLFVQQTEKTYFECVADRN